MEPAAVTPFSVVGRDRRARRRTGVAAAPASVDNSSASAVSEERLRDYVGAFVLAGGIR